MTAAEFKKALSTLGLTQRAFAEEAEIHYNTANRYATGKTAVPKVVAEYLKCRIEKWP